MAEELKPKNCPFCDGKPQLEREYHLYCCNTLGCAGTGRWIKPADWNRRPIEDSLREQLAEEKRRGEAASKAIKTVLDEFEAMKREQRQLLITGKTFEQASENWDAATMGQSIDFTPLIEAQRILSGQKSSPTPGKTGGKGL